MAAQNGHLEVPNRGAGRDSGWMGWMGWDGMGGGREGLHFVTSSIVEVNGMLLDESG